VSAGRLVDRLEGKEVVQVAAVLHHQEAGEVDQKAVLLLHLRGREDWVRTEVQHRRHRHLLVVEVDRRHRHLLVVEEGEEVVHLLRHRHLLQVGVDRHHLLDRLAVVQETAVETAGWSD
jgi:hypothetical protein